MVLTPGLSAAVEHVVAESDTSIALGSGDVAVLGTPRLLALAEEATVAAVAEALDPDETTVGHRVVLEHRAPTAVGEAVRAEAVLAEVDGRSLVFRVTLWDGRGPIGDATITRVVVDRSRFVERLAP
ncbi:MAG: thioesterase [Actinomycetota bacterium]|nr:thioesterase [Actinomycetota bacterium]